MLKKASQMLDEMIKNGLVLEFKKGECVSINVRELQEVQRLIENFLKKRFNL